MVPLHLALPDQPLLLLRGRRRRRVRHLCPPKRKLLLRAPCGHEFRGSRRGFALHPRPRFLNLHGCCCQARLLALQVRQLRRDTGREGFRRGLLRLDELKLRLRHRLRAGHALVEQCRDAERRGISRRREGGRRRR